MKSYSSDDVCSVNSQFSRIAKQSQVTWSNLKKIVTLETANLSIKKTFVELFNIISSLTFNSQKSFFIDYEAITWLQFAFDWITISHSECEQNVKRIRQILLLKIDISNSMNFQIIFNVQLEQMIFLIFVWSYIMFFKWIKLLQNVDEKIAIQSSNFANDIEFKNMISKWQWRIIFTHDRNEYYASWSLIAHNNSAWFVSQCYVWSSRVNIINRHEMKIRILETHFVILFEYVSWKISNQIVTRQHLLWCWCFQNVKNLHFRFFQRFRYRVFVTKTRMNMIIKKILSVSTTISF